jgi:alkanesulfonate monooxygenase SsuD/methylene tetrahydromethanopterin reductase-like flavin-dependent oxidoreductase (luciferase family)
MLYGIDLEAIRKKIELYRNARRQAGYDPATGVVSLMLHTLVHDNAETVRRAVEEPFKRYIKSSLDVHIKALLAKEGATENIDDAGKEKILDYAYHRYYSTGAIFGSVEDGRIMTDKVIEAGVNEIACLVDFGVTYDLVIESLTYLKKLISHYL